MFAHSAPRRAPAGFSRPDFRSCPIIPGTQHPTAELGNKPGATSVWIGVTHHANQEREMADRDEKDLLSGPNMNRRGLLKCMTWAGTGVVWTLSGGVPRTLGLIGGAEAAETPQGALTFVQISDSHIGFHLPPNPDPRAPLTPAIDKIKAMPTMARLISRATAKIRRARAGTASTWRGGTSSG